MDDPDFRRRLTALKVATDGLEMSEQRVLARLSAGKPPGAISSLLNIESAETMQEADLLGVEAAGYYAVPSQPEALVPGVNHPPVGPELAITLMPTYLSNRMKTIAGGSSEIQRNIIAKAMLGL